MRKISLLAAFVFLLVAFGGCEERKITVSEEFYKYATDTIDIVERYLEYVRGYSYEYINDRLSDLELPDLPPDYGIDEDIRRKEVEIWMKARVICTDIALHEENPNTRDDLKKAIDELQEILNGVVVGEVFIDKNVLMSEAETSASDVFELIDEYLYYRDCIVKPIYTTFVFNDRQWKYYDYSYSDLDISTTFLYSNTMDIKTAIDIYVADIDELYTEIISSDCDTECLDLIKECHSTYMNLYQFFITPSGSYIDYYYDFQELKTYASSADLKAEDYLETAGYVRTKSR